MSTQTENLQIMVRTAPCFGPNDTPIPCPRQWASAHFSGLAKRWTVLRVEDCLGEAEVTFSVPPGRVREFELQAAGQWARIRRH